jgi:hypothetical protein
MAADGLPSHRNVALATNGLQWLSNAVLLWLWEDTQLLLKDLPKKHMFKNL